MHNRWTANTSRERVSQVQAKRAEYGLSYCSACDFLKIAPRYRDVYPKEKQ
jgi:hypothetical protein